MHESGIDGFIRDGFLKLEAAFPRALADDARALLWRAMGCNPDDLSPGRSPSSGWAMMRAPFQQAANMPVRQGAFDQLVGPGRWLPRGSLGTFPVRFPSSEDPGDEGWHIDVSFGTESPNFLDWRANVHSRGRALLMLFLFSDVGEDDAPTRIRWGAHLDIARQLAPVGEEGMTLGALATDGFAGSAHRPETLATGDAGTVCLCHPFLVHSAQPHRGTRPRFMAQPPLLPREPLRLDRKAGDSTPVERAIREALATSA